MRNRLAIIVRLASFALVFSGYMAIASVRQYGLGFMAIPVILGALAPAGEFLERRAGFWRVLRQAAAILYMVFIPFSLPMLGLMDAVVSLVIFIQAYLMLGPKNERVYYELYLMSFFLLLAALVQSPEPMIAIALLLYGISAVWAFSSLRMHVESESSPARTRPELRPLGGNSVKTSTGNVFDFGLVFALSALSILSLLLTVIVFLLTPRVEAGWLGRRDSRQAMTGLSETVRLRGGASIYEDPSVVMHVRFPDEPEGQLLPESALYFRVTTLSRFSGDEWSRRGLERHYEPDIPENLGRARRGFLHHHANEEMRAIRENAREVRQLIYMDDVPTQGVPCLDLPQGVRVTGDATNAQVLWDGAADFSFNLQIRGPRRVQYEAFSDIVIHTPESLRDAPLDYSFMEPRDFSLLTYQELLPQTLEQARQIAEGHDSAFEKVVALRNWLSGDEFVYSLDVPPLPARNGIDAFINELRRGHCELYASALALMTRSLGIPARVVSGYRGGDYVVGEQAYLVRASMAHLWVEALFSDHGWVRFDPSPRTDLTPSGLRRMQMAWSLYMLRGKMFWYQRVIGFEGRVRLDYWQWPQRWRHRTTRPRSDDGGDKADDETPSDRDFSAWMNGHVALVSLALATPVLLGLALRRWKRNREALRELSRHQILARRRYLKFLRWARHQGVNCDNRCAAEIRHALLALPDMDAHAISEFIDCYNAVRFGGAPFAGRMETMDARFRQLQSAKTVREKNGGG